MSCENNGHSVHGDYGTAENSSRWSRSREGLLLYKSRYYVPDSKDLRLEILHEHHDSKAAGHFGTAKTIDLVSRNYYWPGMTKFIRKYATSCDMCQRTKAPRHKEYSKLQSLVPPSGSWKSISMDFITELPPSGPKKH